MKKLKGEFEKKIILFKEASGKILGKIKLKEEKEKNEITKEQLGKNMIGIQLKKKNAL